MYRCKSPKRLKLRGYKNQSSNRQTNKKRAFQDVPTK